MGAPKFVLTKGVFYEQYGDRVYLRNVDTRREYFFNETVRDILDCFRYSGELSALELADQLSDIYDLKEIEEFRVDMLHFVEILAREGILYPVTTQNREKVLFSIISSENEETDLFESLQKQCMDDHVLLSLSLELCYRCNERCIHCYIDEKADDKSELNLSDYIRILDEARSMGCLYLLLTGGEVTMKDCFIEVAEYASSIGMLVDIYSNGLDITPKIFNRICKLKPNSLSFSLYGGTAEAHDTVSGVRGSFDCTLNNILMTKRAGIDTYIKTVVMRETAANLEELLCLSSKIGVEICPTYTVLDTHSGKSRMNHRLLSSDEIVTAMRMFSSGLSRTEVSIRDIDGPICAAGQCSLAVNPYGIVTPCLTMKVPLGDIRKDSLRKIWYNSPHLEYIRNLQFKDVCSDCRTCIYAINCDICLGRIDFQDIRIPSDVCVLARAKRIIEEERREQE